MKVARRHFLELLGHGALGLGAGALLEASDARPDWPPPSDSTGDDFWAVVRAQYPVTQERVYLNTGGLGPAPYPVLDAVRRTMMDLQRISETGHERFGAVRPSVARFVGADPEEIAFQRNATEGNSTVASGLDLQQGDEVIFESHAHPGGAIPWMNRQKQGGITVKLFEPDPTSAEGNLQRIDNLITSRTRAIQVSHVTAPTGIRFPVRRIADLAHDNDIWFHIDGAQSAGMFPVDLHAIGCDSYATSGHKWMGAPHGTGILYVRQDRLDAVAPTEVGAYTSSTYELPDVYDHHSTARRYEAGTRDAATVEGIGAAVAFLEQIGMNRVARYTQGLAQYLQDELHTLDGVTVLTPEDEALSGAMTTFKTEQVPHTELNRFFRSEYDLRCRIVEERGLDAVRVSMHIFNSKAHCDRVVQATEEAVRSVR